MKSRVMTFRAVMTFTLHWTQMADRILMFMIGHLGLGSNVQPGLMNFKVLRPVK